MPNKKYMVVDLIQDLHDDKGNVIGVEVTDKAGNKLKVKKGQGGRLADRWGELVTGTAYEFEMGEFKGYPFVENFHKVDKILDYKNPKNEKPTDHREQSIEAQVAIKEIGECWRADKMKGNDPEVLVYRAWILDKLNHKGVKNEDAKVPEDSEDTTEPPTGEVSGHSGGEEPEPTTKAERIERCRELATQANRGSNYLKAKYKTTDINRLTIAQLTELEQDLQGQIEASEFF